MDSLGGGKGYHIDEDKFDDKIIESVIVTGSTIAMAYGEVIMQLPPVFLAIHLRPNAQANE